MPGKLLFDERILVSGLEGPWEITWGPDNYLWVTERKAGRIIRVDPADGTRTTADLVPGRGQDRTEEQAHPALGETWDAAFGTP